MATLSARACPVWIVPVYTYLDANTMNLDRDPLILVLYELFMFLVQSSDPGPRSNAAPCASAKGGRL